MSRRQLPSLGLVLLGGVGGAAFGRPEAALLGAVLGGIVAWSLEKGGAAGLAALARGAVLGSLFLTLVGPGADSLISGTPLRSNALLSIVAGGLVGGALGVKNYRKRKPPPGPSDDLQRAPGHPDPIASVEPRPDLPARDLAAKESAV